MHELEKTNEIMDRGDDLDYTVIHIPSCSLEIECEMSVYYPNARITLDDINKYFYRIEGDPFKDLKPFEKFEAIVMLRPTRR